VPTLLIIGDKDNTAIGKDFAPPAVQATLSHYPELAKAARSRNAAIVSRIRGKVGTHKGCPHVHRALEI
jgi:hypothetical protein